MDNLISAPLTGQHETPVNLPGLMQVLSKHLYSTPMVAIRELVQNAHDAIVRRRLEEGATGQLAEIRVTGDTQTRTIVIHDTGSGLTEQEIHDFLATVGVGYTRHLRQQDDETGLIGMFGLGFLSAFVLAERVTVHTTSWKTPDEGWLYASASGETYSVTPASPREPGTTVTLHLKDEFLYLANNKLLSDVLGRYCILMKEPLFVGEEQTAVNHLTPPWRVTSQDGVALHPALRQKQNIEFASRFERAFTPLCTLLVEPSGDSDAVGMLWLQDGATYGTSDNRNLSLFLRGMLLDDQARELLPPWAGFVGGVIESNRLTPTASREDLQRDVTWYATQAALTEALINGLADLAKQQPAVWRRVLVRHNEALLGAAICDDRLFDLLKDELLIPTSQGDLPVKALRQNNTLNVMLSEEGGFEEMLFRLSGRPVALGYRYAVVPFLRRWATLYGARLVEVGTSAGNEQLFALHDVSAEEEAWWSEQLRDDEECVMSSFEPATLPLVMVVNRDAELKARLEQDDADRRMSTAALMLARQFASKIEQQAPVRLYINFNNPAVKALSQAWRAGQPIAPAATQLLKSLKIILALATGDSREYDFRQALDTFSCITAQLITPTTEGSN
ncbi:ATP-binding protein [Cronobacter sakazakii]|uniref:ATP-binding protein n=1 Tax=Cronobacter sakazakii TaxID=28141 RepID=UPI000CFD35CA|nr:ATP-binding protein [Cronobacter sakazakii]ELY2509389.1 ATP-binding protein [Cronobacter sakazakii]ELY2630187.1 ATP-binding protein [Cronobacter sakazakii]ELY2639140.1 ATP-binding protein [Cronobacter sakazakii]ELY2658593.1 ATP-binding protein [Cronobacter sakazakii]ELY4638010.1 ATP-binding protein [Cronobacter sakazakii]